MVNYDDGVDYDAASMLIMDQMIMTTIPDAFFVFKLLLIHGPAYRSGNRRINENP